MKKKCQAWKLCLVSTNCDSCARLVHVALSGTDSSVKAQVVKSKVKGKHEQLNEPVRCQRNCHKAQRKKPDLRYEHLIGADSTAERCVVFVSYDSNIQRVTYSLLEVGVAYLLSVWWCHKLLINSTSTFLWSDKSTWKSYPSSILYYTAIVS